MCPKGAIALDSDGEGFLYPEIDSSKCVGCGLCMKVCPVVNRTEAKTPICVLAAKASDTVVRESSSSGGVFSLLAKEIVSSGGVVFGAAFDHSDWHVYHQAVETEDDLMELRGSKYVQSDIRGCYNAVKSQLLAGREVLFSGTPCQIAGLKNFIGMTSHILLDRLFLVEIVCHAVPSPLAWRKYLEQRVADCYDDRAGGLGRIRRIAFRSKKCGWKRFSMSLGFGNGTEYSCLFPDDPFMKGFLAELYNRPSCHHCYCRNLRSGADIVLGDFWGIEKTLPSFDDDRGVSVVIALTEKGFAAVKRLAARCDLMESRLENVASGNRALVGDIVPHAKRQAFFAVVESEDFDELVQRLLKTTLILRLRQKIMTLLSRTWMSK